MTINPNNGNFVDMTDSKTTQWARLTIAVQAAIEALENVSKIEFEMRPIVAPVVVVGGDDVQFIPFVPTHVQTTLSAVAFSTGVVVTEKRKRGRPRTRPLPDPSIPKRPRGRPRKVQPVTPSYDIVSARQEGCD